MGKWFQDKSFSAKKWGQGGTNARKIHRDINARKLHRALGVLLAAALIFQTLPFDGIAVSASESSGGGLCTHHRSHTQDCGYKEAEAGHTCTHEHTEDCYRIVEGEDGSTTKELDCHHEHDESCGYRESAEGSPCTFVCEICNEGTDGTPEDNTDGNGINDGESENPGIENENEVKEPDTGQEECICEELCTEDNGNNGCRINTDCPVCGAEGASLSDCKGKDTEDSTEDTEENTDQPEDTDLCKHHREHDDTCGYLPESEDSGGSPCTYECRICPIEKLIAALPDAADITEDNEEEVRAQLEEILALYRELNEDEQGQIDLSHCYELQEKLDAANIPDPVEEGTPDLELFGQKVCSGDSGDGWSYADGVLTLADYHSDNSGEVFVHITNADLEFTLYLKGDNSVKTSEKLIYGNAFGSTTITGDQGASLSLDGKSWADRYIFIRGVNVDVTTQGMIFLSYDMEIDNATVNFNMNGSNGYIYTTHGGLTIKNRSDVTITNLSGAVDYCVATNKAAITDSTLKITNPSGFGVYVTKISTQVSEYKASITNSTISAYVPDAGIHCEEEMAVTNSQVTGSGRFLLRSKKAITVDDSSTMKGIIYEFFNSDMGAAYQVYGSHTLAANLTVAENGSFVIPDGAALTIPDGIILENNGTMRIHEKDSLTGTGALTGNGKFLIDVNEDMISVPEGRVYTGKDYTDQIILEENATVCGVEFTADTKGWTRNIEPAVVKDAGEYKVTFTKGGKEISKTFTVAQSGTQFVGDGVVKTYKGSVVCSDFTADDTITVKATPTATGAAPTKAAARLRSGPTAGQMAVFVGDMQVSEAVDVGADGSYAIAVKAADVLKQGNVVPNGDPITLTAKFVGNNNMADAAGTVPVNISAVAKVVNGSSTTFVGALADAFTEGNSGATVTLLTEVDLGSNYISISGNHTFTLDLNGQTVKATERGAFYISGGSVTIQDSGTGGKIESSNITIEVYGGTLSIQSGTVSGFRSMKISSGTVNISGGTISGSDTGLWVSGGGSITISGGTFSGVVAVQVNNNASVTLKDMLATGYAYHRNNLPVTKAEGWVDSNTWGEVSLDTKAMLTGTVTVKKCNHTGEGVCEYTPNEGAETHAMTCLACGYAGAAESCAYSDDYGHDETNHWQTCTLCGGKKTEAHGWVHQCTSATGIIRRSCDKCEIETVVGTVSITPDFSVTYGKTGSATLICTAELADGYSLEPADSADNCWVLMALSDGKSWNLGRELEVKLPADLPAGEYWYNASPRLSYQGNNTIVKRFNVIGQVTVTPAPLTVTGAAAKDRTYDGTNSVQITGVTLDGVLNSDNVSVDLTGLTGTLSGSDAETYTSVTLPRLTLTGGAASNYTLPQSMGAVPASVTISKATLTATGATVASKTYDGNTAASVSSVTFTGLVPGEALALGTDYTATGTFADASAGANKRATIVVELKSSAKANNYTLPKDSSVNAIGTITAIPIADKNVTLSPASAVYDGTEQKPTVTIAGLTEGTDYTVSYIGDFTKAGEHTVTVTGKGNYTGTVTKEYAISKADVPAGNLAYTPPADLLYTGQPKTAAVTVNNLTGIGTVTVKYKKDNSGDLLAEAKEPGTYHVYADISVGQNYNATQIEMDSFTISYMDSPAVILYNGEAAKGWYNGDVVITADGYTVSDTLGEEYKDSYTISAQEGTVAKTLYFKDAAGHMSGGVEVTVKFDLTPPTGEIAVGAKWWQNVLHFISFGNYAAKEYTVTIKAEDKKGSGISKIEYAIVTGGSQYTDADTLKAANLSWKEYNSVSRPTVPVSNSQYVVYARLTDNVGNVTYISTDGILLDNTPPTVGSLSVPEDTRKDVTAGFTFTVSEAADYYYVVLPKDSAAPDPEDIIVTCGGTLPEGTGTAISGTFPKGSGAVSADTLPASVSVEAENLSPNTAYTVYVTAVDRAVDITDSAEGTPAGNIAAVQNVDFTTKKTLPVITKAPAVAGTYGQSVGEMTVTGGTAQAGSTVLVGTWTVSDADKNEKPSAGTSEVTVIFKPDNANYDSVSVQASLTVSQRNLNAEGVTVSEVAGTYTYTGSEIRPPVAVGTGTPAAGIYISDSGAALTASDFTVSYSNHKDAGTASVTITGKGNYTGSVTRTFTIGKAPGREVPDVSGSYTDNGQTYTYTVTPTEGAVYRMGNDGKWQEENVFEGITPGTSVTFYAKMPETGNYEDGTPKSITVDFPKLTPAAPALSYKADRTNPADVKVTITPVSGAEYSFDGGKTWTESNEQGGFTTSDTVTLAIRLKETDTHNQSPVQTVTVNLAKKDREAPPAFSLKVEANGETDYTVTIPATEGCEYSFDGEHWSDVNVKTGVSVGETVTGYKRYKETNDYNASSAVSAKETMPKFTVKTPVISPAGGSYEGNVSVTITCASPDAEIYYTTDGSAPGRGSTRYTGAFTVTAPATVKAIAVKEGLTDSAEASVTYTKKSGGGSGSGGNGGGGNGNSGGNEDNGGQGSGTNPGNGSTTPQPSVTQPTDTNTNPGNETAPGTGTTPVNPGNGNTSRPGAGSGSGTGTPAQGTKQPFIKGEDGKTGWDVIRAEEEKAEEGSVINVDMNGSVVVPGDIFDSIKGKDITITFDMGNGILWSVDGKSITTDKAGDIDFSVKSGVKTVPVDIINNVTGESYSIQISLAHEGEFGFTAVLSIGLGKENAGYTASLYYYNESTGELEFICKDQIAEDGTVSLAFTHASDYVIAIDGEQEEGDGAAEPIQPEGTDGEAGDGTAENSSVPENPGTGQTGAVWWIMIVILLLTAAIGAGVFVAVKKKGKDENGRQ